MIIGNGIDIVEIERIKKAVNRRKNFLHRIFTSKEIQYIKSRKSNIHTISGLFAAKEAVSKALGTGIRNFKWKDIEIIRDSFGKPDVILKGEAKRKASSKGIKKIHISISHNGQNALAFAIAVGSNDIADTRSSKEMEAKDYQIIEEHFIKNILPKRSKTSHKGDYGRVAVIAGSLGMTGASYLTSMSSLRSGSGLVYTLVPKSLNQIMEIKCTEAITLPVEDYGKGYFNEDCLEYADEFVNNVDVIALGPGLGIDEGRINFVKGILQSTDKPIVLDADGINCITYNDEVLINRKGLTVITPHPGELSRLLKVSVKDIQADRVKYAKLTTEKYGVITVLKGANTVVCDLGGNIYLNETGNPGMATAGSGDVLTGIIASFIGQGIKPELATVSAVYIHGLAGDMAAEEKGEYGLIASDILEYLPYAIKKTLGGRFSVPLMSKKLRRRSY